MACASPAYLAKHGTPVAPPDLSTHDLLGFDECLGCLFPAHLTAGSWKFRDQSGVYDLPIKPRIRSNNNFGSTC
ncbi:hypothetical protein CNE_BB1p00080 (plasmid) [Cupriavidus necator N-1]|uniref:LysR family transcriptional regulator n=1 Tax=Cupriavidus necator (strain ATCC 43291 / DSM 13513 / CCUG 52238 / LMG 8453 / N-1) TaxID=1042878 RepID=F8GV16_CUPNN|nr:hypothetical protein CNE_BB1p00080 [Cupriavidus necator N-1]